MYYPIITATDYKIIGGPSERKMKIINGFVEDITMTNVVTVNNEKKMTFEEKCKTPKGIFNLNVFCAVCWSFVTIMNVIDFDPSKKFDIFLLVVDTFLAVYYLVSSLISYRKMIKANDNGSEKNEVVQ